MMKNLLRSVGIGCLIAGGILYASGMPDNQGDSTLEKELAETKSELEVVKKELAITQTITADPKPSAENTPDTDPAEKQADTGQAEENSTEKEATETVVAKKVTVRPGSTSADISQTLERTHIIEDAAKFDTFMKDYGYAGKIQIGTFDLTSDMSFKEIAEQLTK